jgi:large subunit ribosomal protein L30
MKLKITQTKSKYGRLLKQRETLATLGLKRPGQSVVREDNAALRGMIHSVRHLVSVEPVE